MKPPQVSIALPVYNGEDYLFDALMSFKNQTYPYFELIICDNASTDATPKIAEDFSRSDHRFVHARETDHVDAYRNFLRAYSLSNRSHKYFLWACDDNVWAPTFLEKTVGYLESHAECVLCGFFVHHFRDNGQISYRNYVSIPWYFKKARLLQFLFERRVGYSIYGLMRRSAIDTIRLQFDCRCYVDTWILLQMRTLGTIHVIQEDLLAFRSGGSSTTKDDPYVANVIDLIFTEQEMEILLSLDRLSALEKVVLAQKMAYIARRHRKPDTSSRWWLSLAHLAAGIKNGFEQTRHSS